MKLDFPSDKVPRFLSFLPSVLASFPPSVGPSVPPFLCFLHFLSSVSSFTVFTFFPPSCPPLLPFSPFLGGQRVWCHGYYDSPPPHDTTLILSILHVFHDSWRPSFSFLPSFITATKTETETETEAETATI
jgi:hypothetical protein